MMTPKSIGATDIIGMTMIMFANLTVAERNIGG